MKCCKVLVVDDQQPHRQIVGELIKKLGLVPVFADRGTLALDILAVNPDIVALITDMMMVGMNGDELVRAVRSSPTLKKIPILMVSAYLGVKDIQRVLSEGVDAFLPKPISKEKMRGQLTLLLPEQISP